MKAVNKHTLIPFLAALVFALGLSCTPRALAADDLDCKLAYQVDGWSLIYKHATGTGTVTCNNGKSIPVKITAGDRADRGQMGNP